MTQPRDDFEHRLGQGLKRWAEAGKPTMDLEEYVQSQTNAPVETAKQPRRRSWRGWLTGVAAAAAVLLGLTATFPTWAGAASGWPIIGPVVREIIMKDAGLQWAYENGILKGTVAEVEVGGATVRILGVMADARRTTLIYQVTGLPVSDGKPVHMGERAESTHPWISIRAVEGQGAVSWSDAPIQTPLGLVGTVNGSALPGDAAVLEVQIEYRDQKAVVQVPASRVETDHFSRETAVNQTQEVDGITITLHSVIHTPVETLVHYTVQGESFIGPGGWDYKQETHSPYVEVDGKRHYPTGGNAAIINGKHWTTFAPVNGPFSFIVQKQTKGLPVRLEWPLQEGATQRYGADEIVLSRVDRQGTHISLEWVSTATYPFVGISQIELVDKNGQTKALTTGGEGNNLHSGKLHRLKDGELPPDFDPVLVRALQVGVQVDGPWRFTVGK